MRRISIMQACAWSGLTWSRLVAAGKKLVGAPFTPGGGTLWVMAESFQVH
jgi:hypothetical protein